MNLLWFLIIGLTAGFLAGAVVKGHGFGTVLGGFVFDLLGIGENNLLGFIARKS